MIFFIRRLFIFYRMSIFIGLWFCFRDLDSGLTSTFKFRFLEVGFKVLYYGSSKLSLLTVLELKILTASSIRLGTISRLKWLSVSNLLALLYLSLLHFGWEGIIDISFFWAFKQNLWRHIIGNGWPFCKDIMSHDYSVAPSQIFQRLIFLISVNIAS